MNQLEELEAEVARLRARRKRGIDRDKLRKLLNLLFLLGAGIGLILYFLVYKEGERLPALYIIGGAMLLKIVEFVLRFTA